MATITVTNSNDMGAGSLRAAVAAARWCSSVAHGQSPASSWTLGRQSDSKG